MKLEVNNSGAWKTVLVEFNSARLAEVKLAVTALVRAADRHTFRLVEDDGYVSEFCDARGWRPSGFQRHA